VWRLAFLALAALSSLMAILALPRFDCGLLAWVCLVPLLFALRRVGVVAGAGLGLVFGWIFGAGTFAWLTVLSDMTAGRFCLLVTVFSLFYAVFGALYALASPRLGRWMVLGAPTLWVAIEYARASVGMFALPWNFLAHSQYRYLPVIQIADLTGVYGISFVLVVANQWVSEIPNLVAARRSHGASRSLGLVQALTLAVVVVATLLYGWHRLSAPPDAIEHVRVALVQANVSARSNMSSKEQMAHIAAYARLTRVAAAERPALIVWPSSSLPGPLSFWMIRLYVDNVAQRAGAHLLVGGAGGDKFAPPRDGHLPYSNSEFLIAPAGGLQAQYDKVRLTPFNEYLPLNGRIAWPRWITTLERSFVPGERYTVFQVAQARFGTPICWENAFADLFRRFVLDGANFMVSVTNEGAFGATAAPYQTMAMNVFRAVENRVAIARAATTGVSAFVDPKGAVVAKVTDQTGRDVFVPGVLVWDVPLAQKKTLYTLVGDVFARVATVAALAIVVLSVIARRRARRAPETSSS
jgi:apolipoprotein N-acyltransferase